MGRGLWAFSSPKWRCQTFLYFHDAGKTGQCLWSQSSALGGGSHLHQRVNSAMGSYEVSPKGAYVDMGSRGWGVPEVILQSLSVTCTNTLWKTQFLSSLWRWVTIIDLRKKPVTVKTATIPQQALEAQLCWLTESGSRGNVLDYHTSSVVSPKEHDLHESHPKHPFMFHGTRNWGVFLKWGNI